MRFLPNKLLTQGQPLYPLIELPPDFLGALGVLGVKKVLQAALVPVPPAIDGV
jgi:hypothetical protein